jgi:hypothetical protein
MENVSAVTKYVRDTSADDSAGETPFLAQEIERW